MAADVPQDILDRATRAAEAVARAKQLVNETLELRRQAARELRACNLSYEAIGKVIGVAHARVPQILNNNAPPRTRRAKPVPVPAHRPVYYGGIDL